MKRYRARRRDRWVVLIFWAALFCPEPSSTALHAEENRRVRMGYSALSLSFLPHLMARDAGVFQKHGLDMELIQMAGPLQVVALAAGDLDFGAAVSPALFAAVRGLPLRAVMIAVKTPLFYLVSEPRITAIEQLAGKKVAVDSVGALQHIAAKTMLRKKGADPDRVSYFQTGSVSNSLAALNSGTVSAAILSIPLNVIMTQKGFHQLTSTQEAGVNYPPSGLSVQAAKIQKESGLIKRVLEALLDAMRLIAKDRPGAAGYIQRTWRLSPALADDAYGLALPTLAGDGKMKIDEVQEFLDVAYENGQIQRKADAAALMDYSLLDELLKERRDR